MKRFLVIAMVAMFGFAFGCGGAATPEAGTPEVPDGEAALEEVMEEEEAADETEGEEVADEEAEEVTE